MSVLATPSTSHLPRRSLAAEARIAALAPAGTRAAALGGRVLGKPLWPGGDSPGVTAAICSRLTCRRDHATWSAWSRARHATSAGDICRALFKYQRSLDVVGCAVTPAPGDR